MKIQRTTLPCLYLQEGQNGSGRVAYLPAGVDRIYWRSNQPDHAELLASLVRWVAHDDLPVRVTGPGCVDVHGYVQGGAQPASGSGAVEGAGRVIVHLVNLTHANTWKAPVDELVTLGEQRVSIRLPPGRAGAAPRGARLLVAGRDAEIAAGGDTGDVAVIVPGVQDHEVVVLELEPGGKP